MRSDSTPALPSVVDRATWQAERDALPQRWRITGEQLRTDGRPTAQSRLESGRSDEVGPPGHDR